MLMLGAIAATGRSGSWRFLPGRCLGGCPERARCRCRPPGLCCATSWAGNGGHVATCAASKPPATASVTVEAIAAIGRLDHGGCCQALTGAQCRRHARCRCQPDCAMPQADHALAAALLLVRPNRWSVAVDPIATTDRVRSWRVAALAPPAALLHHLAGRRPSLCDLSWPSAPATGSH